MAVAQVNITDQAALTPRDGRRGSLTHRRAVNMIFFLYLYRPDAT